MKIMIHVTKEIIAKSRFCELYDAPKNCAISFAVAELFPYAKTFSKRVCLLCSGRRPTTDYFVGLPEIAQRFIVKFDTTSPPERLRMDPVQFEIHVPDFIIDEIGISQVYKILSESKTLTHVNP